VTVSEADRLAAAQSYIDALVGHDGDTVPFTPECIRIEQGIKTGFSGNHLRRSLNRGPQFRLIAAVTAPDYTISGDQVHAVYDVVTKPTVRGRRVAALVDESFVIPVQDPAGEAKIHHIRARFRPFVQRGQR
jgi:hypothetical protein